MSVSPSTYTGCWLLEGRVVCLRKDAAPDVDETCHVAVQLLIPLTGSTAAGAEDDLFPPRPKCPHSCSSVRVTISGRL